MTGLGETEKRFLKLTLLLLLGILPGFVYAQTAERTGQNCHYHIHGIVVDEARKPIAGATIFITELVKGDATTITGDYKIEDICAGEYTLVCSFIGYEPDTVHIRLSESNKYLTQNFRLKEQDIELRTVTIVEQKLPDPAMQPTEQLRGLELESTRGKSLGESLKSITGVTTLQTGPSISKPVIHGLHSNRILILNAGIRQEGQQWGSEHAPEIDPFVASSLSVVKGAAGVRYGPDAIGGVILVEPAPLPRTPGLGGELNMVGWSNNGQGVASGILEGNLKKASAFSWRLQGTAKRAGNAKAPAYYLKNSGVQEFNFSAAAGYQKQNYGAEVFYSRFQTKNGIFAGAHIGNITDLERAIEYGAPLPEYQSGFSYKIGRPYQQVTHQLLKASAFLNSKKLGKFTLTYASQHNYRGEYDLHRPRGSSEDKPELEYTLRTHTSDLIWEHKPVRQLLTGSAGISTFWQGNVIGGRYLIPNFRNQGIGFFVIERLRQKKWEAEIGIRYDLRQLEVFRLRNGIRYEPVFHFNNIAGSLGASYKLNSNLSFSTNLGTAWRPPAINELFSDGVHHGAAAYEKGDTSLIPEKAYNITLSAQYEHEKWNAEVGIYQNYIDNYIYLMPVFPPVLTIRGAFPSFRYTQVHALFRGIDASVSYKAFSFATFQSKLSLIRALNRTMDQPLPFIPADRLENTVKFDIPHIDKLNHLHLQIALSSVHVSKQWRTPSNSDYAPAPEGYTLFNAETSFSFPALDQAEVGLGVSNIFNIRYKDYLNRFRYFTDEMGRNFSIRLKYKF